MRSKFERPKFWQSPLRKLSKPIVTDTCNVHISQFSVSSLTQNGLRSMDELKEQMSGATYRRWVAQKRAGKELTCNSRTANLKDQIELAWAFDEKRQADKNEIMGAIGGVCGVVDEVLEKVSSIQGEKSTSSGSVSMDVELGE